MKYFFVLGNAPELAYEEVTATLRTWGFDFREVVFVPSVLVIDSPEIPQKLFNELGGTVKTGRVFADSCSVFNLASEITKLLESKRLTSVDFGLSVEVESGDFQLREIINLSKEIKRGLKERGIKSRYVLPQKGKSSLSSVVVSKQNLVEIMIGPQLALAESVWTQNFEDWSKRDYGRPEARGHIGMLPPKVARMMVNLGASVVGKRKNEVTLLDPFCGVGTIIAEAMILKVKAIGADYDPKQIERTQRNLQWLVNEYHLTAAPELYVSNATKISQTLSEKIDCIVTEPFLGPNDPNVKSHSSEKLNQLTKNLCALYVDCLQDWKSILASGGKVVLVLPSLTMSKDNKLDLVKTVIDKAILMGYSLASGPFPYFRPQAIVRRNICVFEKNDSVDVVR